MAEQRITGEVQRARQVPLHPLRGRCPGIGCPAEVEVGRCPVPRLPDDLPRALAVVDEAHVQGVDLVDHPAQRGLERLRVHRPVDLQALADAVARNGRPGALFGQPDLALCRGQGKDVAIATGHGGTSRSVGGRARRAHRAPPAAVTSRGRRAGAAAVLRRRVRRPGAARGMRRVRAGRGVRRGCPARPRRRPCP